MARSILSIVCLSFLLIHKFIDCETRGNFSKTLETNDDTQSTISHSPNTFLQLTRAGILRNIKTDSLNTIVNTLEIPKTIEYQERIVKTPAKPDATAVKTIKYKLGKRIAGDRLVASNALNQQWRVAQNVTQNLSYPKTGTGSFITYIEIIVEQSLNMGRAFVTSGGIAQRQIAITIEAPRTLVFRQNAQIYGH